jgi:hypothetical protein
MERIRVIKCEVFSRVVGYYQPVETWNLGKREEFKDRASIDLDIQSFDTHIQEDLKKGDEHD